MYTPVLGIFYYALLDLVLPYIYVLTSLKSTTFFTLPSLRHFPPPNHHPFTSSSLVPLKRFTPFDSAQKLASN